MSVLVPLISFVLLLLISHKHSSSWRHSFLTAGVLWGLSLTIITEILSIFQILAYSWILLSWSLMNVLLVSFFAWYQTRVRSSPEEFTHLTSFLLTLGLSIGFIVIVTGLIALWAPPNTEDSMTYHMSRIRHWMQNQEVAHYPTNIERQLYLSPLAEFAITHFYLLSGTDRLANAVQWFSMLGSILGVSLIAKQLGGDAACQLFAALVAASLPMGILQASSTQTDYVVTFWLVCLVYYAVLLLSATEMKKGLRIYSGLLIGISLGLALLTKATSYFYGLPFFIWLAFSGLRKLGMPLLKALFAVPLITVVLNLGHYLRNLDLYGNPLVPASHSSSLTNQTLSPAIGISNVLRNMALHLATPFPSINARIENALSKLHSLLGFDIKDVRSTSPPGKFGLVTDQTHEDLAGNPIHLFLICLGLGALMIAPSLRHSNLLPGYALSLVAGFLLLCLYIRWMVWNSRYHLPLFVLWSPFVAIAISKTSLVRLRTYVIILLVVTSQFALFHNKTRPLIGMGIGNIFAVPRLEQYFRKRPELQQSYLHAAKLLQDQNCTRIGLWTDEGGWEYPFWILLDSGENHRLRIEHVNVDNESARKYSLDSFGNFSPCAILALDVDATILALDIDENPSLVEMNGETYSRMWMTRRVSLYSMRVRN